MFTSLITAILANGGVVSLICNVDKLWGNDLTGTDEYWYRFLTCLEAQQNVRCSQNFLY